MADKNLTHALGALLRLASQPAAASLSDGALLAQFVAHRDEAAFSSLLSRHGPMVLGVCQRVLGNSHDAEDAFQATFLLLARKAGKIQRQDSVASWLARVATRAALTARSRAVRRHTSERQVVPMAVSPPAPDPAEHEMRRLLDEELGRLPTRYHAPLVLCYLQGHSYTAAAELLHWPLGTLKKRLGQGRELLRQRLTRRGVTLAGAALGALLAEQAAPAAVPAALLETTARSAMLLVAGEAAAASPAVLTLVTAVQQTMGVAKMNLMALAFATLTVLGGLALAFQVAVPRGQEVQPERSAAAPAILGDPAEPPKAQPGMDLQGDPLPPGALARLGTLRRRAAAPVAALAVSADGKYLATAAARPPIPHVKTMNSPLPLQVWDAATGKLVWEQQRAEDAALSLAFAPDGRLLAVGGVDGIVRLRKVNSGEEVRQLDKGPGSVLGLAFSPDGQRLAASYGGGLTRLWDVASGKKLRHFGFYYEVSQFVSGPGVVGYGSFRPVALSARHIAISSALGTVSVHDVESGKEVHTFKDGEARLAFLAFSPDGTVLAAGGDGWAGQAKTHVWSLMKGELLYRLDTRDLQALAFSADGSSLYAVGDFQTQSWEAASGRKGSAFSTETRFGRTAFSLNGRTLAGASHNGALRLWEPGTGKELHPLAGSTGALSRVAFFNRTTLLTSGGGVRLWDLNTLRPAREFPGVGASTVRGQVIGWDYANVTSWDAATGQQQTQAAIPEGSRLHELAVSPDGRSFAVAYSGSLNARPVCVCRRDSGRRLHNLRHERADAPAHPPDSRLAAVYVTAYSPDSGLLLTAGESDQVVVWSVLSGRALRRLSIPSKGHSVRVSAGAFSSDGQLVAVANNSDWTVHVWDTVSWEKIGEISAGKDNIWYARRSLAFSPDGRWLAVADGNFIDLAEMASLKVIRRLTGHRATVTAVAFSADGRALASGSEDTTALLWDVRALAAPPAEKLTAAELDRLWIELNGKAGVEKALQAMREFTARPEQAAEFLGRHLRAAPPADDKRITRWIADLASDDFSMRQKAEAELERLGEQAGPALRKAVQGKPSLDLLRRLEVLLTKAEEQSRSAEQQQAMRALIVLERIGTPAARQVLQRLAGGAADAWLTDHARQGLQRLADR